MYVFSSLASGILTRTDQKAVGNSHQPIGVIMTGNLFIKAPC